jgi:hypothetical protein
METLKETQLNQALIIIDSNIANCRKFQVKFIEGSSQSTLLINRIKALSIAQYLLKQNSGLSHDPLSYTQSEIKEALIPLTSILHKCEKASLISTEGSSNSKRLSSLIFTMKLCLDLIQKELSL